MASLSECRQQAQQLAMCANNLSGSVWSLSTALCQGSSELQNGPAAASCQRATWCLPAPLPQISRQPASALQGS